MPVTVLLFAAARARVGFASCGVELAEAATVADLKAALAAAYPDLAAILASSRVAVDRAYAADTDPIPPGAELAVIPPVSGGAADRRADQRAHRRSIREGIRAVQDILLQEWDPLGVGDIPEAQDEYDSYAPEVYGLLQAGADESAVVAHLASLQLDQFGLSWTNEERDRRVARRLAMFRPDRGSESAATSDPLRDPRPHD